MFGGCSVFFGNRDSPALHQRVLETLAAGGLVMG